MPFETILYAVVIGYFLGSIPFGLILTRLAGLGDIRTIGSGNIGATNVLRTGHKGLAASTLLLDLAKGAASVLIVKFFFGQGTEVYAGIAAFCGHIFPVWLRFKGGKGVATFIGVLASLYWPSALAFCVVWLTTAFITRYSSLSALLASAFIPALFAVLNMWPFAIATCIMTLLVFMRHSANIKRLWNGNEPKIGAQQNTQQKKGS